MENQTLTVALALVTLVACAALLMTWAANRHVPGLLKISIGFAMTGAGILMLPLQGSASPIISIFIANSLIMAGRIPTLMGLASFWSQDESKLPLYLGICLVGTEVAFFYYALIDVSIMPRVLVYTVYMVLTSLATVYVLYRGLQIERQTRPVMMISSNFGAYLLLLLFSVNAVGEFALVFLRTDASLTGQDGGTSVLLLGSIVTMMVFAFGVIIMTMEELTVEHKENAIYDPITTILNHRTFLEVGQRVLGVALRYTKPVSLLTFEVGNMDEVVEEHGFRVGNEMLRHFSLMASDRRRNEDVLARSSFNEFRMLLPGVDEKGAQVVIAKINKTLAGEDFEYRGKTLNIEFVFSSITKREEDLHLMQMLQEGEIELFRTKQGLTDNDAK